MKYQTANDQYLIAMRRGQKEVRELTLAGKDPNPPVLDKLPGPVSCPPCLPVPNSA